MHRGLRAQGELGVELLVEFWLDSLARKSMACVYWGGSMP